MTKVWPGLRLGGQAQRRPAEISDATVRAGHLLQGGRGGRPLLGVAAGLDDECAQDAHHVAAVLGSGARQRDGRLAALYGRVGRCRS